MTTFNFENRDVEFEKSRFPTENDKTDINQERQSIFGLGRVKEFTDGDFILLAKTPPFKLMVKDEKNSREEMFNLVGMFIPKGGSGFSICLEDYDIERFKSCFATVE